MIRKAGRENGPQILEIFAGTPALGVLCAMNWNLQTENPRLPYGFYRTDWQAAIQITGSRGVYCGPCPDSEQREELSEFLSFCGLSAWTAAGWHPPNWRVAEDSRVMELITRTKAPPKLSGLDCCPSAREVMAVLEHSGAAALPEAVRESFWVDFNVRRNHNAAAVYGLRREGRLVSTAGLYAIAQKQAYLACVETLPDYQGQGYAKNLIRALCHQYPDHQIYLLCQDSLQAFYQTLGFETREHRVYTAVP